MPPNDAFKHPRQFIENGSDVAVSQAAVFRRSKQRIFSFGFIPDDGARTMNRPEACI
jgi:hypothetical protein